MESPPPNSPGPGQRSLAAIVFTDVVSFSARMQSDEETTLRLLRRDFDLMRGVCTEHHGSVLKTTGDGLLLYFSSAVQAVACALATQRALAEHAKGRPAGEVLTHRVGIHLGDVFVNEQDVMGDGVNIAARLQAEAEPGGICISQTVYDVVRNKLALHVTRLGPRELKNISQSIPIYRLLLEAQQVEEIEPAPAEEEPIAAPGPGRSEIPRRPVWRRVALLTGVVLVLLAGAATWRNWRQEREVMARVEAEQAALDELMADDSPADPSFTPAAINRTLADWRAELQQRRSRALEEYDFAELGATLRDPKSPVAGQPEARVRAQVLQRTQQLFSWLTTHLQQYDRAHPLVVRELTGTAPKEIGVYVGSDRRLYYAEGGAVRQRDWKALKPGVIAAIVAGAIAQAETLPPREAVQGSLAFAALYRLPELPKALKEARRARIRPR